MCPVNYYQLFLQAVGIVTIAIIVGGLFMVWSDAVEIDLTVTDDPKKGGKQ